MKKCTIVQKKKTPQFIQHHFSFFIVEIQDFYGFLSKVGQNLIENYEMMQKASETRLRFIKFSCLGYSWDKKRIARKSFNIYILRLKKFLMISLTTLKILIKRIGTNKNQLTINFPPAMWSEKTLVLETELVITVKLRRQNGE